MITNNTISLTFFPVRGNAPMCFPGLMSYVLLIAETTLKLINNSRYKIFGFKVFKSERVAKPGLIFKTNF